MTAAELVAAIEAEMPNINFDEEFRKYDIPELPKERIVGDRGNGQYMFSLAAASKILKPKHALELGTYFGTSAMAIAKFAEQVTTCDIDWTPLLHNLFQCELQLHVLDYIPEVSGEGMCAVLLNNPNQCLKFRPGYYDFIYVDIGNHNGIFEHTIHEALVATGWTGFVFYDDVNWGEMEPFWNAITNDKVNTGWHGKSGFGIVRYGE